MYGNKHKENELHPILLLQHKITIYHTGDYPSENFFFFKNLFKVLLCNI